MRPQSLTINTLSPECLGMEFLAEFQGWASAVWTTNLLVFVPLILPVPAIVNRFFWANGATVSGSTDVGVYNEDGTSKLGSTGSTLNSGTSAIQSVDVTDFYLPANRRMWLALGCDNATQTFWRSNLALVGMEFIGIKTQASGWSSGLPASITLATPSVAKTPLFGFTGNSVI